MTNRSLRCSNNPGFCQYQIVKSLDMASAQSGMVDSSIFETLQSKIDEDAKVREELRNKLQDLDKQGNACCISINFSVSA